jgi:L-lactate utilization protein LutC
MQASVRPTQGSSSWETIPDTRVVEKTAASLRANGFKVDVVPDKKAALEKVRSLLPDGANVMTGGSTTLSQIGFTDLLASGEHRWVNMKGQILAEKDPQKQTEMRQRATFADYFLGSVHALTQGGQLVAGSATGSQLAAYSFGARNLILVVGTHKITKDVDEALKRLREHSVPLEDKRMKGLGRPGTVLSKILIYEMEPGRNVHVILVNEPLGF